MEQAPGKTEKERLIERLIESAKANLEKTPGVIKRAEFRAKWEKIPYSSLSAEQKETIRQEEKEINKIPEVAAYLDLLDLEDL